MIAAGITASQPYERQSKHLRQQQLYQEPLPPGLSRPTFPRNPSSTEASPIGRVLPATTIPPDEPNCIQEAGPCPNEHGSCQIRSGGALASLVRPMAPLSGNLVALAALPVNTIPQS